MRRAEAVTRNKFDIGSIDQFLILNLILTIYLEPLHRLILCCGDYSKNRKRPPLDQLVLRSARLVVGVNIECVFQQAMSPRTFERHDDVQPEATRPSASCLLE